MRGNCSFAPRLAGEPSEHLKRLAEASLRDVDALIATMKPGAVASEVAQAGEEGHCLPWNLRSLSIMFSDPR